MIIAGQIKVEKRFQSDDPPEWGDWIEESFDQDPSVNGLVGGFTAFELFGHLPGGGLVVNGDTPFQQSGDEVRFTLLRPLAVQVVYRLDTVVDEVQVEGDEQTLNVLPADPQTLTPAEGEILYLLGLRWHPWTAPVV